MSDSPETGVADEALSSIRRLKLQLQAMRKALEQSMDAPGGTEWEEQISAAEAEDAHPEVSARPRPRPLEERDARQREQIRQSWPDKPKPK